MKSKLIILVLITAFCLRCEKDPPEKVYITENLRSFFDFKNGSYWVYKNVDNDELDSVVLKNYSQRFSRQSVSIRGGEAFDFENISYEIEIDNYHLVFGPQAIPDGINDILFLCLINTKQGDESISFGRIYEDFGNEEVYSNLQTQDSLYTEVYKDERKDVHYRNPIQKYYLKKGVGFVKLELANGKKYELLRYSVIK